MVFSGAMIEARRLAMDPEMEARNRAKVANNALPVLIGRAGGQVEITKAEFEEIASRYGGPSQMTIQMDRIGEGDAIRLTLVRKPPLQGDLPV
jgi:hypothetical protein